MDQCNASSCKREAVFRVFWPGKTVLYCEPHKNYMIKVGEAMGLKVEFEFTDQAAYDSVTTTGSNRKVD